MPKRICKNKFFYILLRLQKKVKNVFKRKNFLVVAHIVFGTMR